MTRDQLRQKCIDAMKIAVPSAVRAEIAEWWLDEILNDLFDSLHGLVRVVPIEATEEMLQEWYNSWSPSSDAKDAFNAMAAAGDLTRPK